MCLGYCLRVCADTCVHLDPVIGFCATISSVIAPSLDCSYFGRLKSNQGVLGDFLVEWVYHLSTFYESKTEEEEICVFVLKMLMALMMTVRRSLTVHGSDAAEC
mgnify:CR=1 FL=1